MIYGATAYGQVEYGGLNDAFTAVSIYDSVTISENVAINISVSVNVYESVDVSENIVSTGISVVSIYENIVVSEGENLFILIDSFSEINQSNYVTFNLYVTTVGQSFANGNEIQLDSCKFYLKKSSSPSGDVRAKLYAITGTYGTNSIPNGPALAVSNVFNVSSLTSSYQLITFVFSGANRITLEANTKYCVTIEGTINSGGYVLVGDGIGHSGNSFYYSISPGYGGWYVSPRDLCFYVYGYDERLSIKIISYINAVDSIIVSEYVVNDAVLLVTANDSIIVSETIYTEGQGYDVEFEDINISENINLYISTSINTYDDVTVSEGGKTSTLVDSYSESNFSNSEGDFSTTISLFGQSFTGDGFNIDKSTFFVRRSPGATGNVYSKVYAHSGVYGTSSVPTGPPLAVSDAVDITTIPRPDYDFHLFDFTFSGENKIKLENGVYYTITIEYSDCRSGYIDLAVGLDSVLPSHSGNFFVVYNNGSYYSSSGIDTIFYVYSENERLVIRVLSYIDATDSITASDVASIMVGEYYIDSETVNVSENINLVIPVLFVSENEVIDIVESNTFDIVTLLNILDDVAVSDDINPVIPILFISVNDQVSILDDITRLIPALYINNTEYISILENITLLIPILFITKNESITISDVFQQNITSYINENESITVTDSTTGEAVKRGINYPFPAGSTYYPYSLAASGSYGVI